MIIRGRETGRQRINEGMEEERVSTLLIVHALRLEVGIGALLIYAEITAKSYQTLA